MDKANEYLAHAQIRPVGEAAVMVSFGDIVDRICSTVPRLFPRPWKKNLFQASGNLNPPIRE